ncbi:hypothetical protein EHM76_03690 [bacterium]|nr:MAG: hypothetical protein EHM76_03690 [bacterium]
MHKLFWQDILVMFCFAYFLVGCSTTGEQSAVTKVEGNISSPSATSQLTATFLPTGIPASTVTPLPEITFTPLVTPNKLSTTWTPLPTLSDDEAHALLQELLNDNGGCRLPCWWGITPGQTTWQDAQRFLETFTSIHTIRSSASEQIGSAFIPFPQEAGTITHDYIIRNGIVQQIRINNYNYAPVYNLDNILIDYGKPDEVWISAYYEPRYSTYMVAVAIFYQYDGILIMYYDGDVNIVSDQIHKYPQKARYPFIYLWSPQLETNFKETAKEFLDLAAWPSFIPLEKASGMTVEKFYEAFKNPDSTEFIATPIDLWKK